MRKFEMDEDIVEESLQEQARNLEQEGRMILPGIQTLFGFQLIAVFNQVFSSLPHESKILHLTAILLATVSLALAMAPAAYHREVQKNYITKKFVRIANHCLCWAILPLALSMVFDIYVIAQIILEDVRLSMITAIAAAAVLLGLWYVMPRISKSMTDPSPAVRT